MRWCFFFRFCVFCFFFHIALIGFVIVIVNLLWDVSHSLYVCLVCVWAECHLCKWVSVRLWWWCYMRGLGLHFILLLFSYVWSMKVFDFVWSMLSVLVIWYTINPCCTIVKYWEIDHLNNLCDVNRTLWKAKIEVKK